MAVLRHWNDKEGDTTPDLVYAHPHVAAAHIIELEAEVTRLREGILRIQNEFVHEYGIGSASDFIVARVERLLHG